MSCADLSGQILLPIGALFDVLGPPGIKARLPLLRMARILSLCTFSSQVIHSTRLFPQVSWLLT